MSRPGSRLGAAQYEALATLLRMPQGATRAAARRVLVDGEPHAQAAAQEGIAVQSVANAITRIRRGLELARIAAGVG